MAIEIGSTEITGAYIGSTKVDSIYIGSVKVWPTDDTPSGGKVVYNQYRITPGDDGWQSRDANIGYYGPFGAGEAYGYLEGEPYWGSVGPDRFGGFSMRVKDSRGREYPEQSDDITLVLQSMYGNKWGNADTVTVKSGNLSTVLAWKDVMYGGQPIGFTGTYMTYVSGSKPWEWAKMAKRVLANNGSFDLTVGVNSDVTYNKTLITYTKYKTMDFVGKSGTYSGYYGDDYKSTITPNTWQPDGKFEHVGWVANGGKGAVQKAARSNGKWNAQDWIVLTLGGKDYPMYYNYNIANGEKYTSGFDSVGQGIRKYMEQHKGGDSSHFQISHLRLTDDSPVAIDIRMYKDNLADGTLLGYQSGMDGTDTGNAYRATTFNGFGNTDAKLGRIGYLGSANKFVIQSRQNRPWNRYRELNVYIGYRSFKLGWNETSKRYDNLLSGESIENIKKIMQSAMKHYGFHVIIVPSGAQDVPDEPKFGNFQIAAGRDDNYHQHGFINLIGYSRYGKDVGDLKPATVQGQTIDLFGFTSSGDAFVVHTIGHQRLFGGADGIKIGFGGRRQRLHWDENHKWYSSTAAPVHDWKREMLKHLGEFIPFDMVRHHSTDR